MKCVLIRHGKTQGNIEKRYIGCRTDEPLSESGVAELLEKKNDFLSEMAEGFWQEKNDRGIFDSEGGNYVHLQDEGNGGFSSGQEILFVSPMLRARQTAEILFPGQPQIVIDELKESDFGRFEGKNYQELNGDPDYQRFIDSGGSIAFPEGEAPADFQARSFAGFDKAVKIALETFYGPEKESCLADLLHPAKQDSAKEAGGQAMDHCEIRIVAHGGTVMSVMSRLTGENYFDFMVTCGEGYAIELDVKQKGQKLSAITECRRASAETPAAGGAGHPLEYVCKRYRKWPSNQKDET